jgi:transcriptional regulator with XRE-family HTH domain
MSQSVHLPAERIVATVAELVAITPDELKSSRHRRSVECARAAAAHLLRTHCGLSRAEIAQRLGRSTQTISDLTTRARQSLRTRGAIAELVVAAHQALNLDGAEPETAPAFPTDSEDGSTRLPRALRPPCPIPGLRAWRRLGRRTQQQLARDAGISRETLIRLEAARAALPHILDRLADALCIAPEVLIVGPGQINEETSVQMTFPVRHVGYWRQLARLSQAKLAARVGIARETLLRIENGRPARRQVVIRIANALVLAPSVLIGETDLDETDSAAYRCCSDCGALRPLIGFVRIKGYQRFLPPVSYMSCQTSSGAVPFRSERAGAPEGTCPRISGAVPVSEIGTVGRIRRR